MTLPNMKKITINGTEHPFKLTINAAKELQAEIEGKELADLDSLLVTLFYGVKGGHKASGSESPFIHWESIGDEIEMSEIESIAEVISGKKK